MPAQGVGIPTASSGCGERVLVVEKAGIGVARRIGRQTGTRRLLPVPATPVQWSCSSPGPRSLIVGAARRRLLRTVPPQCHPSCSASASSLSRRCEVSLGRPNFACSSLHLHSATQAPLPVLALSGCLAAEPAKRSGPLGIKARQAPPGSHAPSSNGIVHPHPHPHRVTAGP